MYPVLFQYFINLLTFLFTCYCLGKLLLNLTTLSTAPGSYFRIFLSFTIGFMAVSAGTAAFATGFHTVLLFYFLLLAGLLYWYRKPHLTLESLFKDFFQKELLVLFLGAMLLYISAFIALRSDSPLGFVFPWRDTINYAALSNLLFNTGVESFYVSSTLADKTATGPVPYHYFELWLNAAISEILGGLYMHNFTLVMAVGLRVTIYSGLLAVCQIIFGRINVAGAIFCFLLLFLKGIVLPRYMNLPAYLLDLFPGFGYLEVPDQLSVNTEGIKFLPGYLFFLGFVLGALRKDFILGILLMLAFPVAHIVAFPGTISGIGFLGLLYLIYFRKRYPLPQKSLRFILISVSALLMFLLFFYLFLGAKTEGSNSQNIFLVLKSLNLSQLQKMLIRFGHYVIKFVLVTWPFLLVLLPAFLFTRNLPQNREHQAGITVILVLAAAALLSGAMLGGILFQNFESHQLLQILVPVLNITVALLLFLVLKRALATPETRTFYLVSGSVLLLLFLSHNPLSIFRPSGRAYARNYPYDDYSKEYLRQVQQFFEQHPALNPVGSCILGPKDLDYYYAYSPFYYTLGLYLPYMLNNTFVFSLSEFYTPVPADPEQAKRAKDLTAAGAFYKFVGQQQKSGRFISIEQSQLDFIRKHRIEYVIISPNAPPNPLLEKRIRQSITDPATGERLALLMKDGKSENSL